MENTSATTERQDMLALDQTSHIQYTKKDKPVFNFLIDCNNEELAEFLRITDLVAYRNTDPEAAAKIFAKGHLCWCFQTYFSLSKRSSLPVACSNRISDTAINICHSPELLTLGRMPSVFIVCVRADFPRRRWAQYEIVQNKLQLNSNASFVPLWPQPGLMKRDTSRRGVQTVAFAGQAKANLAGRESSWKQLLAPYGLEFVALDSTNWHDFSEIDVLVGIRSFDRCPHNTKPPNKLINAWHGNVPFVGGYDSAFMQVGRPGEDYLLASTPQEALAAIIALKEDEDLYRNIVENGKRKAMDYTPETICRIWEQVLSGPVMHRYNKWKSAPFYEDARFKTMLNVGLLESRARRIARNIIRSS